MFDAKLFDNTRWKYSARKSSSKDIAELFVQPPNSHVLKIPLGFEQARRSVHTNQLQDKFSSYCELAPTSARIPDPGAFSYRGPVFWWKMPLCADVVVE